MPISREWGDAYLAQAREDLAAARVVVGTTPSVFAMLLQMTFEKLAKAALLRGGVISVDRARMSHAAASRMIRVLQRNRGLLREFGRGYQYAWKDVLPVVTELERAQPQLAAGLPQLEYPWLDAQSQEVRWPAAHLPVASRLGSPGSLAGARVLRFAERLAADFDAIFP